jgi:hypothetical protein
VSTGAPATSYVATRARDNNSANSTPTRGTTDAEATPSCSESVPPVATPSGDSERTDAPTEAGPSTDAQVLGSPSANVRIQISGPSDAQNSDASLHATEPSALSSVAGRLFSGWGGRKQGTTPEAHQGNETPLVRGDPRMHAPSGVASHAVASFDASDGSGELRPVV